jgi:molybdate transport system substrate-binding protein
MIRLLSPIVLLCLLFVGCIPVSSSPTSDSAIAESRTLTVFAAASLTDAFTEIGANFETANPGVTVTLNFAGSQALSTQILEGAPADVFASANTTQMDAVVMGGFVAQDAPQAFLTNALVIIVPEDNPAGVDSVGDLADSDLKLVLAAEEVPVGRYSREAFDLMNTQYGSDFKDKVLANVVSNEDNVKQVVAKVQLGEADAGIVYTSDAVAAPELPTIEIPVEMNVIAAYPIAPLLASDNPELAAAFVEYVLSPKGQVVLQKWGFGPVS